MPLCRRNQGRAAAAVGGPTPGPAPPLTASGAAMSALRRSAAAPAADNRIVVRAHIARHVAIYGKSMFSSDSRNTVSALPVHCTHLQLCSPAPLWRLDIRLEDLVVYRGAGQQHNETDDLREATRTLKWLSMSYIPRCKNNTVYCSAGAGTR